MNFTIGLFLILQSWSSEYSINDYKSVFPLADNKQEKIVPDPISDKPVNTKILVIYSKENKLLGFVREVTTSTGCNSECLPVIFTLYYNSNGEFLTLRSRPGLTKKYHAAFTGSDYKRLELILTENPSIFSKVNHPTEMVDAFSGATLPEYSNHVISEAAYSTLRINTYNQQSLTEIRKIISSFE